MSDQKTRNLLIFAAARFFNTKNWIKKIEKGYSYSYNGSSIFDFQRKGYARLLPQSSKEFELFDFITGNLFSVKKSEKNKLSIRNLDSSSSEILSL